MTKCQYKSDFPCYNEAKWIVKMKSMSFGKMFSKFIIIDRICDQCHDYVNPEHKKSISIDISLGELAIELMNRDKITYENAYNIVKIASDNGYTCDRVLTFRRYKK